MPSMAQRLRSAADGGMDIYDLHCDVERAAADLIDVLVAALDAIDAAHDGSRLDVLCDALIDGRAAAAKAKGEGR